MGRNWDWSKQRGRERRLEAERQAFYNGIPVPETPPLHSHDATMQSYFNKGWNGVSRYDISLHLGQVPECTGRGSPLARLRSLRKCHLQQ